MLGPVRAVEIVPEGSLGVIVLQPHPNRDNIQTVTAALALARRGLPLLHAKRAMERLIKEDEVMLELSRIENRSILARELAAAGVRLNPPSAGSR